MSKSCVMLLWLEFVVFSEVAHRCYETGQKCMVIYVLDLHTCRADKPRSVTRDENKAIVQAWSLASEQGSGWSSATFSFVQPSMLVWYKALYPFNGYAFICLDDFFCPLSLKTIDSAA